ncbi:MAG: hypothetical protein JHD15_00190 [Phenylobacterium sp.]|uniref:hypothetical protein n=1 Tax=Phenylobacterium sp. TaxID=1871053 RepID=UPI001A220018|nr:hypothetical protein [Phenylobacterium sp.]MBJ7408775.1 hypothetical protein [Phenylobacterium sp.]
MKRTPIETLFFLMPLIFGFGFIAPLLSQLIVTAGLADRITVSPLLVGLVFGGVWGGYATWKGRWL